MRAIYQVLLLMGSLGGLLATESPAQVVRVANLAPVPFSGWKRTTIDVAPPKASGQVGAVTYVVGRAVGLETRVVDLRVTLAAGEQQSIDLATATETTWQRAPLPANPLDHFGGMVTLAGQPMEIVALVDDGAGYTVTLRTRVGRMLCATAWVTWWPDQPAWCHGEAVVVASNPAVPDMTAVVPAGFDLRFGDALVAIPGAGVQRPLIAAGTVLADGQGKAMPLTFVWLRHLQRATDWSSVGAAADLGIGAVGIRRLLADGNPSFPIGFSPSAWASNRFAEAARRMHTWDPPIVGPSIRSSDTGAQEAQLFHPGGEAMQPGGVGCEWVRLLSDLKLFAERPVNHLEVDGSPLDPDRHPQLLFWDARVHPSASVSPDRLGKLRDLAEAESHGRWGPDTQHWITGSLHASARLTGSPASQWLLSRLAVAYLLQRTSSPGWSTSGTFSAREWGYEGLWVVDCHRNLEDRGLAARVVQRWRERVQRILLPTMSGKDVLQVFDRDPRVNASGPGVIWWQESLASFGIDLACTVVGPTEGRAVALRIAHRALDSAWRKVGTEWLTIAQGPMDGTGTPDGSFNAFGMPLCVATTLRQEPQHPTARLIWAQLQSATGEAARRWLPPGVQ